MTQSSVEATSTSFDSILTADERPVLVAFWAPHCRPCLRLHPALEEVADDPANGLRLAYVNVDVETDLAVRYEVLSIPTVIYMADGVAAGRIGASDRAGVLKFIHQVQAG